MIFKNLRFVVFLALVLKVALASAQTEHEILQDEIERQLDSIFISSSFISLPNFTTSLTEADMQAAADSLGVELAVIKAVIEVEAGHSHCGIIAPGIPLVVFQRSVFLKKAEKNRADLKRAKKEFSELFSTTPNRSLSRNLRHYNLLKQAMDVDYNAAIESTFWGMFQIGGFNWKRCGASSPEEFAFRMSLSEKEQLRYFTKFIQRGDMLQSLRDKNWERFAVVYNGPAFRRHSYHVRLAEAYKKHKLDNV
ncbi:MAG: N-acetylmuramidase family protein [Muribaculaceae bacterium]|nr:N-acetylmuramidase family protein [Muribaculaceae bacterium]